MGVKFTNNGFGTLAAGITSTATTITLGSGQGARFPVLGVGDYFYGTLINITNNLEIVKVTARSTDVLTVVRGVDGTTAQAYLLGDKFELRPTAAGMNDKANTADKISAAGTADYATNAGHATTADSAASYSGTLPQSQGGTGGTDAATARAALGAQATLGFTPVQQGGGTGQGTNKIFMGFSGSRLKVTVDTTDFGNVAFDSQLAAYAPLSGAAFTGGISAPSITNTSDARKKKSWASMPRSFLAHIASLQHAGTFSWKKRYGSGRSLGLSAQEVETFCPEAVVTHDDGFKSVNYGGLAMVAIVEMARELQKLRVEIAELKAKK